MDESRFLAFDSGMALFFQSHEITLYRRRRISNTDRFTMSATFTAYPADIQPANQERTQMFNGRFGAVFTAFVDSTTPVKEGDQVVTLSNGKRYSVKGVQTWAGAGLLDYTELVLIAQDA